ncbi:MAG: hypothetical protein Ct9H300mP11_06000 [Chloroflexota bacterium]|nr:MAG: hypothetical protein Ct9H300mP11_06000 [Chloroflexota bacterium]
MPTKNDAHRLGSKIQDDDAQTIYRHMLLARSISEKSWLLTRQGRVLFTCLGGQEAADVASATLWTQRRFYSPLCEKLRCHVGKGNDFPRGNAQYVR